MRARREATMIQLDRRLVDLDRRMVLTPQGTVRLTSREAQVLAYLAGRPSHAVPREELLREVWGHHEAVISRALDTLIARLRNKIEANPAHPAYLLTEYGVGYSLALGAAEPACAEPPRPMLALSVGQVDLSSGRVFRADGIATLCRQELALLRELMRASGTIDRGQLERRVWGTVLAGSNRLRNAVYRLRAKIELDPSSPQHLLAVRGAYRLQLPEVAPSSGPITLLRIELDSAFFCASPERAAGELWTLANAQGGYLSTLSEGRACLVFAARPQAEQAARRFARAFPSARLSLASGEARPYLNPLTRRYEYLGLGSPEPVLLHEAPQHIPAGQPELPPGRLLLAPVPLEAGADLFGGQRVRVDGGHRQRAACV
jgi:DNA-binding response OmpR family regulator